MLTKKPNRSEHKRPFVSASAERVFAFGGDV
jgi:hypothetical protein